MASHVLEVSGLGGLAALKAVASETRLKILMLLASREMNIHELAEALSLAQPSITRHMIVLEEAGLVQSEMTAGVQGLQKRCRLRYNRMIVDFEHLPPSTLRVEEVEMPVGLYSRVQASPTCGLANRERILRWDDDPQAFFQPERATAQLLWMADGFVEYLFPNTLPASARVRRLTLSAEVCSEARGYNNQFPSEITVWINGAEIGTWTSPGDMGGTRGRLNPVWWHDHNTQYGFLTIWDVSSEGTSINGKQVSEMALSDFSLNAQSPITVRIGVKPGTVHAGGFNLFGRGFGNHEQALILRLHYGVQSATPS